MLYCSCINILVVLLPSMLIHCRIGVPTQYGPAAECKIKWEDHNYFPVGSIPFWFADPGTNKSSNRRLRLHRISGRRGRGGCRISPVPPPPPPPRTTILNKMALYLPSVEGGKMVLLTLPPEWSEIVISPTITAVKKCYLLFHMVRKKRFIYHPSKVVRKD